MVHITWTYCITSRKLRRRIGNSMPLSFLRGAGYGPVRRFCRPGSHLLASSGQPGDPLW